MHSQQRKTGRRAIGRASRAAHLGICPPAETGAPLPASAPLRILVVEKDAALRRRAIERLAAADTSLVLGEAASVQEALENAATDSWDVIVLDARRPIQIAAQKNEALLEKLSAHFNAPGEHEGSPGADPMREQLRSLSARLLEAREQERAAISRRVHDELGQALTALQWDVTWLTERLGMLDPVELDAIDAAIPALQRLLGDDE